MHWSAAAFFGEAAASLDKTALLCYRARPRAPGFHTPSSPAKRLAKQGRGAPAAPSERQGFDPGSGD